MNGADWLKIYAAIGCLVWFYACFLMLNESQGYPVGEQLLTLVVGLLIGVLWLPCVVFAFGSYLVSLVKDT